MFGYHFGINKWFFYFGLILLTKIHTLKYINCFVIIKSLSQTILNGKNFNHMCPPDFYINPFLYQSIPLRKWNWTRFPKQKLRKQSNKFVRVFYNMNSKLISQTLIYFRNINFFLIKCSWEIILARFYKTILTNVTFQDTFLIMKN